MVDGQKQKCCRTQCMLKLQKQKNKQTKMRDKINIKKQLNDVA